MPYTCWFLWWQIMHIEDSSDTFIFNLGLRFKELFWERYILKGQIMFEGHWRLQSWTLGEVSERPQTLASQGPTFWALRDGCQAQPPLQKERESHPPHVPSSHDECSSSIIPPHSNPTQSTPYPYRVRYSLRVQWVRVTLNWTAWSYRCSGWVWEITGWSSRLQENLPFILEESSMKCTSNYWRKVERSQNPTGYMFQHQKFPRTQSEPAKLIINQPGCGA